MKAALHYKINIEGKLSEVSIRFSTKDLYDEAHAGLVRNIGASVAGRLLYSPGGSNPENIMYIKVAGEEQAIVNGEIKVVRNLKDVGAFISGTGKIGISFDKDHFERDGEMHYPQDISQFICEEIIFKYCGEGMRGGWKNVVFNGKYHYYTPVEIQRTVGEHTIEVKNPHSHGATAPASMSYEDEDYSYATSATTARSQGDDQVEEGYGAYSARQRPATAHYESKRITVSEYEAILAGTRSTSSNPYKSQVEDEATLTGATDESSDVPYYDNFSS